MNMKQPRQRILNVITQLDMGGAERQLLNLCRGLDARQFDCRVLSLKRGGTLVPDFQGAGATIYELDRRDLGGTMGQLIAVARLLRRVQPDILQTWLMKGNHVGRMAAAMVGQQHVVAGYRDMGFGAAAKDTWLDSLLGGGTERILHNSRRGREAFLSRVPGAAPVLQGILPNGIDSGIFQTDQGTRERVRDSLGIAPDEQIVVMVSRLHRIKDPVLFLALARQVLARNPATRFWLLGGGPLEPELRRALASEPLDRFWLAGERSDIPELLAAADLSVLTSRSEGLSNSILEAMCAALPVMATDVGGNGELIRSGVNGYLFGSRDPRLMAESVVDLLQKPDHLRDLGRAGAEMVRKNYTLPVMLRRAHRFYRRLLAI
jgi:glycosyltransferase involved in cell wall biosynthesis